MRRLLTAATLLSALSLSHTVHADQPMGQLKSWQGNVDFFATGAPMAVDGNDADFNVDQLAQPATVTVSSANIPAGVTLRDAYLFWGGSIVNDNCVGATIDDAVTFTAPGAAAAAITADACYCSDAGATSYDIQLCRKDVTSMLTGSLSGDYVVDQFDALVMNASTNTASFSLVVVFSDPSLPPRRVGLWDGLLTMHNTVNPTTTVTLSGLDIDTPAEGDLTWYVMEGDVGGSVGEQVSVTSQPSAQSLVLSDGINPADNPMNHTINTVSPPETFSIGVDIDRFSLNSVLSSSDNAVDITYQAGDDKYWIAYNIMGVNVFEPVFGDASAKSWTLENDADANSEPSPGDTVRYTVHLENSGTAPGVVSVTDAIPAQAASWSMVSTAGGTDNSSGNNLSVSNISVAANASADVQFDVVLDDVPDETAMDNTVAFDASPDGDMGSLQAPTVTIRRDGDSDTVFDNDDNCPDDANPLQEDSDMDGMGDACDPVGSGGMGGAGPSGSGGTGASGVGVGGSGNGPSSGSGSNGDDVVSDSGCGCTVAGAADSTTIAWLALLGAAAFAVRRRRR